MHNLDASDANVIQGILSDLVNRVVEEEEKDWKEEICLNVPKACSDCIILTDRSSFTDDLTKFLAWLFSPKIMVRFMFLLCLLTSLLCIYNSLIEALSKPTILKARAPLPFFPKTPYVNDHYSGNAVPGNILNTADVIVVMFYAPWSLNSRAARQPFEVAARIASSRRISFHAINCWVYGGLCRRTYKLMTYPIIMAYSKTAAVAFSGDLSADHLTRWSVDLQRPVHVLYTLEDIERVKYNYEYVVVMQENFLALDNSGSPSYRNYLAAAFVFNSGNAASRSTVFCVSLNKEVSYRLGLRTSGDAVFIHRNSRIFKQFGEGSHTNVNDIVKWVQWNSQKVQEIHYISRPQDVYFSQQLADLIHIQPMLITFFQAQSLYEQAVIPTTIMNLAAEYKDCGPVLNELHPRDHGIPVETLINDDEQSCNIAAMDHIKAHGCCKSMTPYITWAEVCASGSRFIWENQDLTLKNRKRNHWTHIALPNHINCESFFSFSADSIADHCCVNHAQIEEPILSMEQSYLFHLAVNNTKRLATKRCLRGRLAKQLRYRRYPKFSATNMSVRGYGCVDNSTLQFALLDTRTQSYLLRKWGLTIDKQPVSVIIDNDREAFYLMNSTFSSSSLRAFVADYHQNALTAFSVNEGNELSRLSSYEYLSSSSTTNSRTLSKSRVQIIRSLTREQLLHVLDSSKKKDKLVFFSSGSWHSSSMSSFYALHSVARYFESLEEYIEIYSIDVTINDLPYKLNFDNIPTIVLFLANGKEFSWKYPESMPITAANLISFIASHCSFELRWALALSNCDGYCAARNRYRVKHRLIRTLRDLYILRSSRRKKFYNNHYNLQVMQDLKVRKVALLRLLDRVLSSFNNAMPGFPPSSMSKILSSPAFQSIVNVLGA